MEKITPRGLKRMKKDIRNNPQRYRGNVKLLTGQVDFISIDGDKEIKRLRKKILAYR